MDTLYKAKCSVVKEPTNMPTERLHSPNHAAKVMRELYADSPVEVVVVFHVDTHGRVVGFSEVSRGTIDLTVSTPRDVFRDAIVTNAWGVVIAHNHPGGDLTPSENDILLTARICEAGEIIGIKVVDSIIVSPDEPGHRSIMDEAGGAVLASIMKNALRRAIGQAA